MAWMKRFPDIRAVAEANQETVLAAWEGLGYYSRAKNIHAAARHIMREYGGIFPRSIQAIRSLPGIGEYTAGAIASIAFNDPEPAVDANVLRIFSRLCDIDGSLSDKNIKSFISETVQSLMPVDSPRMFNQGLMELGALICGKNPKCEACPVAEFCLALCHGTVAERPLKKHKTIYIQLEMATAVIVRQDRVFIRKRPPSGLWPGLWEFPGGGIQADESPEQAAIRHAAEEIVNPITIKRKISTVRHGYTVHRVTMHGFLCGVADEPEYISAESTGRWIRQQDVDRYAFPAGHRKLMECLGWK